MVYEGYGGGGDGERYVNLGVFHLSALRVVMLGERFIYPLVCVCEFM